MNSASRCERSIDALRSLGPASLTFISTKSDDVGKVLSRIEEDNFLVSEEHRTGSKPNDGKRDGGFTENSRTACGDCAESLGGRAAECRDGRSSG